MRCNFLSSGKGDFFETFPNFTDRFGQAVPGATTERARAIAESPISASRLESELPSRLVNRDRGRIGEV